MKENERLVTLDEVEIYRDIGCMLKCRRMEWRAKSVYENYDQSVEPTRSQHQGAILHLRPEQLRAGLWRVPGPAAGAQHTVGV